MSIAVPNAITDGGTEPSSPVTALASQAFNSTTGNDLLVFVRGAGTVNSITDNVSGSPNTYTKINGASGTAGNTPITAFICQGIVGQSGMVVTANSTGGLTFASLHVLEVSGAATSGAVDVASYTSGGSGTAVDSSAFSTVQANEIVVALGTVSGGDNLDTAAPTIGGQTATIATETKANVVANTISVYFVFSTVQTGIAADFTSGNSSDSWDVSVVSLKAAGGGAAPGPPPMVYGQAVKRASFY